MLETHPGRECCAEADSGEEAIRAAAEFKPDVIIMDVSMPGMGGVKATQIINETSPASRILLLTLHKSTELLRAGVSAGAIGYVLKSDDENELIGALETVDRGEISLNPRSSAGLFGAAPSVALATLALTLFEEGKLYASLEERR